MNGDTQSTVMPQYVVSVCPHSQSQSVWDSESERSGKKTEQSGREMGSGPSGAQWGRVTGVGWAGGWERRLSAGEWAKSAAQTQSLLIVMPTLRYPCIRFLHSIISWAFLPSVDGWWPWYPVLCKMLLPRMINAHVHDELPSGYLTTLMISIVSLFLVTELYKLSFLKMYTING